MWAELELRRPAVHWQGWDELAAESAPVVQRCSYSEFVASGPVEAARQAFERHECDRPKPTTTASRGSGFRLR